MFVRSFKSYKDVADFDPVSGTLSNCPQQTGGSTSSRHEVGAFCNLGDHLVVLYRQQDALFLRIDNLVVEFDDHLSVHITRDGASPTITIAKNGTVVLESEYEGAFAPMFENDPTPFVEEEDFDFGVFLANLARDADRRSHLFPRT